MHRTIKSTYILLNVLIVILIITFLILFLSFPIWTIHGKGGTVPCEPVSTIGLAPVLDEDGEIIDWVEKEYSMNADKVYKEDYIIAKWQSLIDVIGRLKSDPEREEANRVSRISLW